ncbi:MAG TPA: hypothetical protein VIM44_07710 [Rariglobus sp.]
MNARTEEMLYVMMWMAGQLMQPTYRSLTESFDDWARRSGLERRLAILKQKGLVEHAEAKGFSADRILKLTRQGMAAVQPTTGDPMQQWGRTWDGQWRLVLFDVPVNRRALRMQLWRFLKQNRFGYLQNSVWVTPDATKELRDRIGSERAQVSSLMLLEARPCGGESDAEIVSEAWDFKVINQRYHQYLKVLGRMPGEKSGFAVWREWIKEERFAWTRAVREDPFLPEVLLPAGYLGREAWEQRCQKLRRG